MEKLAEETYSPDENKSTTENAYKTLFVVSEMMVRLVVFLVGYL